MKSLINIKANRVVLAISGARFTDALGNSLLIIIIPLYVAKMPAPRFPFPESVLVGMLISLYSIVNTILQPIMGVISDRVQRRKPLILVGLLLMGLGTLAFIFANQFTNLLIIRSLQGLGVAMTIPASLAIMSTATEKNTRGGSMGIYSTMRMAGFALGPLLGGFLHENFGFNAAFIVGAGFIFLAMVLVEVWVNEPPRPQKSNSKQPFRIIDRDMLGGSIFPLGFAGVMMASSFSMMSALENEFNLRLSQTALDFGIAFSALTLTRLLVQVPLGRLSDRIGRKPLIIVGLILMAPATILLGFAGSTLQLAGARAFQGLASAAISAPAFALAGDLSKTGGEGRQMSILTTGFFLGMAIGPMIAGIFSVYSFELPFIIGGIMSLFGAWIVFHHVHEHT